MDITLYLECEKEEYLDNNYENYYTENSYVKALEDSYNQTKDAIYESMNNGFTDVLKQRNNSLNTFNMFNNKSSVINEKHHYTTCNASLYNENGESENTDSLVKYMLDEDVFICIIDVKLDSSEEEFETEFKMWVNTHDKINSSNTNDEWKLANEPKRDLKIKFTNNINTDSFALLQNCKIIDYINGKGYAILIERISFIKDIN